MIKRQGDVHATGTDSFGTTTTTDPITTTTNPTSSVTGRAPEGVNVNT